MEEEKETEGIRKLKEVNKIEYEDVTLCYDQKNVILDKVHLVLDHPMKVAIVGKSGAGKTSFVNLLPRFYDIQEGRILINDIDYTRYQLKELRNHISYVFQEPILFNMTILENILYGCPKKINRKAVEEVCKKIGLHEKIMVLKQGYNTLVDHGTDILSYGERQLLNFARAILKDTEIMILDEVTSNLDLEFEDKVMRATEEVLKNKFVFIIAHRLKTIKNADLIVFLEDGKIAEMGTHEQLMQKQGSYYQQVANFDTITV